jgi:hypothetical protein
MQWRRAQGARFMFISFHAVPNAPAARSAAGDVASAGGTGSNAPVEAGVQGGPGGSPLSLFESLAGHTVAEQLAAMGEAEGVKTEPVKAKAKSQPTQAAAKPKSPPVTSTADDDDDASTDDADESNSTDGTNQERDAILPDDEDDSAEVTAEDDSDADESNDDADDGEAGDDDDAPEDTKEAAAKLKALEKDNFKTRAKNRELREQLEKVQARVQELESQSTTAGTPLHGMPEGFEAVKTEKDLTQLEAQWQAAKEWAEDHEQEGYIGKDAQGNEVEYTPQQVRQYRRQMEKALKQADKARSVLKDRLAKEADAKAIASKKYPFVLDATSSRHALVKEIESEHPEISLSPQRALLLGRLAVAKLLESGAYELVKKGSSKPAAASVAKKVAPPAPPPPARRQASRSDQPAPFANFAMSLAQSTVASLKDAA